jgi:hypothetical protein
MAFFRGPNFSDLDNEFVDITEAKERKRKNSSIINGNGGVGGSDNQPLIHTASKLMSRAFFRPFSCVGIIYIVYELSGFEVVTAYAQNFFEKAGVELDPSLAAIFSGSFRLVASMTAPLVLMRVPKKNLFVACGTLSAIGMASGT